MSPAEIFDLIAKYGVGVIFAALWFLERGERIDAQKELRQIAKDAAIAITVMEKTIAQWAAVFNRPSRGNTG